LVVGCMFLVAGVLWLLGMRFLKRDTERAVKQMDQEQPAGAGLTQP
jgi:hypothetical protein